MPLAPQSLRARMIQSLLWQPPKTPSLQSQGFALKKRENPLQPWIQTFRNPIWGIYDIIYHCAPFSLINSMITFTGLNSSIKSKASSPQRHFKERLPGSQVYNSWGEFSRPFEDIIHLTLQVASFSFQQWSPKGILAKNFPR
ncbi:hypothetical protein O181_066957 [Austropuccinia psidii MF-1]|uniref:Uncharacterized protein n=1 Tax=Austropuccinia psidii MF-1 TaxID=1389203 RepID=A0A9Q3EWF0_9BASI|nr:hypothetical protein [Austropuccinia psidii MF-1]